MTTATPKPRAKRQPTADMMREQLALASDEIMRLRELLNSAHFVEWDRSMPPRYDWSELLAVSKRPWWRFWDAR